MHANTQNNDFPTFIGIGSQRAGTTWLHECLNDHPEIYVPEKKELHFFDLNFEQGIQDYLQNFAESKRGNARAWGEITPNYYQYPGALERIAETNANVKLIFILREPISRAYSQYKLFVQTDFKGLSFSEVIRTKSRVIDLSCQGKHLQRVNQLFPPDQVLVLFYDELASNPTGFLTKVFRHLGVNDSFVPAGMEQRVNSVVFPNLQAWLASHKLNWVVELARHSPLAEKIKKVGRSKKQEPSVTKVDRQFLAEQFQHDIQIIEDSLSVNLDHWRHATK